MLLQVTSPVSDSGSFIPSFALICQMLGRITVQLEAKTWSHGNGHEPSSARRLAVGGQQSYFLTLSVNQDSLWARG